jgi:hypothetical protein
MQPDEYNSSILPNIPSLLQPSLYKPYPGLSDMEYCLTRRSTPDSIHPRLMRRLLSDNLSSRRCVNPRNLPLIWQTIISKPCIVKWKIFYLYFNKKIRYYKMYSLLWLCVTRTDFSRALTLANTSKQRNAHGFGPLSQKEYILPYKMPLTYQKNLNSGF